MGKVKEQTNVKYEQEVKEETPKNSDTAPLTEGKSLKNVERVEYDMNLSDLPSQLAAYDDTLVDEIYKRPSKFQFAFTKDPKFIDTSARDYDYLREKGYIADNFEGRGWQDPLPVFDVEEKSNYQVLMENYLLHLQNT